QHEFDTGLVGHLRESEAIGPAAGPAFRHYRDGAAGGAIGAEQPELQPVGAAHRGALALSDRALHKHLFRLSLREIYLASPTASSRGPSHGLVHWEAVIRLSAPEMLNGDSGFRRTPVWQRYDCCDGARSVARGLDGGAIGASPHHGCRGWR